VTQRELERRQAELNFTWHKRRLFFWTARHWLLLVLLAGLVIITLVGLAHSGMSDASTPWQLLGRW
jgi:hypothetical protein